MLQPVDAYRVICDGCGTDCFQDDEFAFWEGAEVAVEMAENADWKVCDDKHYCTNCLVWDDDADEFVPKVSGQQENQQ